MPLPDGFVATPREIAPLHTSRRGRSRVTPALLVEPLALLVATPLALFPERFPAAAVGIALGLLLVPYGVRYLLTGRFSAPSAANGPLAFLLLVMTPVALWRARVLGVDFWGESWPELVRLFWGAAVFWGVVNWCNPPRRRRRRVRRSGPVDAGSTQGRHLTSLGDGLSLRLQTATAAFLALGLAFGLVGLLGVRNPQKVPGLGLLLEGLGHLVGEGSTSLLGLARSFNPNRVAALLVLFVPLTLAQALRPGPEVLSPRAWAIHRLGRLLWWGLWAFFSAALLLTQSRAGLVAGGLASLLTLLLAGRQGGFPLLLTALAALAAVDVLGTARLLDLLALPGDGGAAGRLLADPNVTGRFVIWQRALHAIVAAPITGVGLAGFHHLAQQPYPPLPHFVPDPDITHAHNLFLQVALDLGLPGLLAYLALLAVAGWHLLRLLRRTRGHPAAYFWTVGIAAAFAAYLLYNTMDALTLGARPAVAAWFLLGLAVGAGERTARGLEGMLLRCSKSRRKLADRFQQR